ncbi:MAG: PIG-L family deacetylase [Chitinophagaceae bacterium]|nr:PIG-L family deacetylase [Chitinophagaceae bacterium]
MKKIRLAILLIAFLLAGKPGSAQLAPVTASSSDIYLQLKKLNVLGSVLYIAAHPDDENNGFLPYLAKEKLYRTAYLSLTRGDGGQNLIGPEQGIELGMIRTQELLAARAIDGAEQYFTRAYEFGFSKRADEALDTWDHQQVLADVVWMIRSLQPDIIIARFPPDKRAGHGHHAASAIIANEAFRAAADPKQFPEQFKLGVKPWQAKRILWNTFNFGATNTTSEDQLKIDVGGYNQLLGRSYGELGGEARSMHKSQAEGRPRRRGEAIEYFVTTGGDTARKDLLEGVTTGWERLITETRYQAVVENIQSQVQSIIEQYQFTQPEASVPALTKLYQTIRSQLPASVWKQQKLKEVQALVENCSGLFVEAFTQQETAVRGDTVRVNCFVNNRSGVPVSITSIALEDGLRDTLPQQMTTKNQNYNYAMQAVINKSSQTTQPYWLAKPRENDGMFVVDDQMQIGEAWNPASLYASFIVEVNNVPFTFKRPVMYKYVDAARGELYQPFVIAPHAEVFMSPSVALLNVKDTDGNKRSDSMVHVMVNARVAMPQSVTALNIRQDVIHTIFANKQTSLEKGKRYQFDIPVSKVYNPKAPMKFLEATFSMTAPDGKNYNYSDFFKTIRYDHIPAIHFYFRDHVKLVDDEIKVRGKKVGYIAGSGDAMPEALRQLGFEVKVLEEADMNAATLQTLDAIVTGVRAYNIYSWLSNKYDVLMEYVQQGGNLIVQYNRNTQGNTPAPKIGPYPFVINAGARVTEENAAVEFALPQHAVLNSPNSITAADFEGWNQERSTYQADRIDPRYEAPLRMHDQDEPATNGSLITAKYGKGNFAYVSLVLFRQLPAGVPGAFKLLANLIALPKNP